MNILTYEYFFSLQTGILFMTHLAWAMVFLLGRHLIQRKEYEQHTSTPLRRWAGILSVTLALEFLFAYIIRTFYGEELNFYFIYFDMLAIPIGAIVMVILVTPQPITHKRILANLVPFVVCCSMGVIFQRAWLFYLLVTLIGLYVIAMVVYIIVYGLRYEEEIKNIYSSLTGRSIRWMAVVPILLIFLLINYSFYAVSHNTYAPIIYYTIAFFVWNYIYINIYQMVVVQEVASAEEENEEKDEELAPDEQDINTLFVEKLKQVCEVQELYTNCDLTRDKLAHQLKMGHTQFTLRLKEATGMTFYDYINQLRIRKAVELIEEGKMDMWSIGQTVGYTYRSTFYRAFSAIHGCTPAEYLERLRKQE